MASTSLTTCPECGEVFDPLIHLSCPECEGEELEDEFDEDIEIEEEDEEEENEEDEDEPDPDVEELNF